ncbi:hypothetical protein J6590_007793 [Homalodisca vitripennis]|nr:hypothetical protein J6590_007793 [Homalodisca vitripennis]
MKFHAACCRIRTVAKLSKMSAKALTTSRCDECDVDGAFSTKSDVPIIIGLLKVCNIKCNSESFASLEKPMMSVRESLGEENNKLSAVEKVNLTLKEDCGVLKQENQRLAENIFQLKRRSTNCNEGQYVTILKLGVCRGGIPIAHRLPAPRDRRFYPRIVVQFVSRSIRIEWLTAARKNHIETRGSTFTFSSAGLNQ